VSRRSLVLVLLAIAVPAAQTFGFGKTTATCLSIGDASYRIAASGERADYTVRIDPAAPTPDIRIRLTEAIDEADFVFIADGDEAPRCARGSSGGKTVKIAPDASAPDLTIGFASAPVAADYRIYLRGHALAPEAVAALYAVAHMPFRLAGRANGSN
jgi:hypothetical protein